MLAQPGLLITALLSASPSSSFDIRITAQPNGALDVEEHISLRELPPKPKLTRQLWMRDRAPFIRQRIVQVQVLSAGQHAGQPMAHRVRSYGEWTNIDLLGVNAQTSAVTVRYRVLGGARVKGNKAQIDHQAMGYFWPLPIDALSLQARFEHPIAGATLRATSMDKPRSGQTELQGTTLSWRLEGKLAADDPLRLELSAPAGQIAPQLNFFKELWVEAKLPLIAAALALLLSLVLRFAPPSIIVGFAAIWNLICASIATWQIAPNSIYWLYERPYRGGEVDNLIAQLIGDLALSCFVFAFAIRQAVWLRRGDREAYLTQLGLVVWLAVAIPMAGLDTGYLLLPLMGLPLFICFYSRRVALRFGVGAEVIVERVVAAGSLKMSALAQALGLSMGDLNRALAAAPELPLVIDREQGELLSPEVAALRQDLLICPSCGGGTQTKGMQLVACAYCDREFASSRAQKPPRPVPVIVEACARALLVAATSIAFFAVMIAVIFVVLDMISGDGLVSGLLVGGISGGVVGALGAALWWLSRSVREGQQYGALRTLLLLGAPLIVPLLAYRRLGAKRVLLHFGLWKPKAITEALASSGQLSLGALAELLGTDLSDATALARYLASHGLIRAVYDRVGQRLVAQDRYAQLASEQGCSACGGLLGLIEGAVTCHHCGAQPAVSSG